MFLVMELGELDIKKLMNTVPKLKLDEEHITVIFYNMVCALNLLHSANVIHRDLKPANILIDTQCNVQICDFGQARVLPKQSDGTLKRKKFCKTEYKKVLETDNLGERISRYDEFKNKIN
jgi:serine/threonine protein kinase